MRRLLIWAPLVLFALVFALVASGLLKPGDRTVHSAMVGKSLPELALPPLLPDRPGIATGELKGKPRLLNVFASWCIPCIAEAPQLTKLKQAGVEIDAIAVRDTPEAVQAFLARHGDPYARIGDDKASRAQLALGSAGVPETFVIDAAGRIAYQHIGEIREEDVLKLLGELEKAK
ncbi:cytochrome c biogenesis protein CcmG/thiol:disulfide interchange protein DsbE [Sphingomonas naasensis]|uniref:Redoxin domain-containing protein n=1 Tax=Sphingomonas naasensis TaxID=1344951 RepID=A0A4S1WMT6_9SPHN|nr:redoxin family protein [Sphingomonas naasensis]NIJ20510.1 cytochrome c biogenesis protein CcmG/thiol:disulfide interchange protein DsbE [Sphingomonas naasensis]TGX44599.1 redoxin domain-containing protein [Sphingomonas naasensis]